MKLRAMLVFRSLLKKGLRQREEIEGEFAESFWRSATRWRSAGSRVEAWTRLKVACSRESGE